ncbi:MAG TPA: 2-C-methyl-D-erythritol 4-phosphate cytidylyltransferase [Actinomycetota bacterium]|nr:2-C-methyl-D-erythritol 4-phosphate cytidylyltransferase [Actinomycetota bacterium]
MSATVAVVLCAGAGARAGAAVNKVFLELAGRSILERSVRPFVEHPSVEAVYVVAAPDEIERVSDVLRRADLAVAGVVCGGATRHQSESNAVEHLAPRIEAGEVGIVMIHDGARPLFDGSGLDELIEAARRSGGAIPGLPVAGDLVRAADGREVARWVPRAGLWRALTPQVFRADLLLRAFRAAGADGFQGTDTASTVERIGGRVAVLRGDPGNLKVTYPEDLALAEHLLREP